MSAGLAELVRGAFRRAGLGLRKGLGGRPGDAAHEPSPPFQLLLEDRLREIDDPAVLADTACALIAARLVVGQVALVAIDEWGQRGTLRGVWPEASGRAGRSFQLAGFGQVLSAQLAAGDSVQSDNLLSDSRIDHPAALSEWAGGTILSLAAAPVVLDGKPVALILAASDRPRRWDDAELALLRRAGERSWSALRRACVATDRRSSEAECRMAIELCPQIFWAALPDGRLIKSGRLFGQPASTRADPPELGWRRTTHPDELPEMERVVAHCLATGEEYDIEHRTLGADGRLRWVQVHARPMRGADGRIERWVGTITDIDRRKQAEAALKASEERFLRAISGARVGTWDWDMGTDEVVTSPGFAPQFHDLPEGSIRSSRDFLDAIHPDDRDRMARVLADVADRARRHGSAEYEAEYRIIRQDGEVRWLGAQGNVTVSPDGGRGGFLSGLTVDMSERRRAEEMLLVTQDRLHTLAASMQAQG